MTPRARWGAAALWLVPFGAWAVGLGDIELNSGLDQPLEADIVLVSATPEELSELSADLAAPQTFERYGLDRPAFLTGLQFRITQDDIGRNVIRITSQEAITEPFFAMLVEATWSRGRLLREYTLLLDPPGLLPTVADAVEPAQTAEPVPVPTPAPAPQPAAVETPGPAAPDGSTYGPVQRGETLWSITQRYLPSGVTMHQMLAAVFQGNAAAFNGNMNLLLAGASLRIPDRSAATRLSAEEATREALRQTAEWEGSAVRQARLRLVPATDEDAAGVAGDASTATTAIAELQSENSALRSELAATQRLLELHSAELQALQALQARLAAVEQGLEAAETTAALAAERPPAAADGPGAQNPATAVIEPQPAAAEPPLPADVVAAPISQPSLLAQMRDWISSAPVLNALFRDDAAGEDAAAGGPGAQSGPAPIGQPSLLARMRDWITHPLLLLGLGPLALVGIAVWYLRHRRRAEDDASGRWEALSAGGAAATDAALDPGPGGIGERDLQPVPGATGGREQPSEALDEAPDRAARSAAGPKAATASPSAADEVSLPRHPAQGEVDTKLDLARAYLDLGDAEGARSLLEEVVDEGDAAQQHEARTLLAGL